MLALVYVWNDAIKVHRNSNQNQAKTIIRLAISPTDVMSGAAQRMQIS